MTEAIIIAIIVIALVILFRQLSKNKSKWGVNLKRVICPVCGTEQPVVRVPKSRSQALWGGTTCPKCHTNLDKYGNVIP